MITNLVQFATAYQVVIGADLYQPLLRALCEIDNSIPVSLSREPDPPTAHQTVIVLLDSRTVRRLLGAKRTPLAGDHPIHAEDYWQLGALRRTQPGWDALQQALTDRDAPLQAFLVWERQGWRVRVCTPNPDAEDCDIPF